MKNKWAFIVFPIILLGVLINTYIHSRAEYRKSYNFRIKRINVNSKRSLSFYNNLDEKIQLWNYLISDNRGIKVGDSISKAPCEEVLNIFRIDSAGNSVLYLKVSPSPLFPRNWFCD